jgi:magnesium chelatase subunit I
MEAWPVSEEPAVVLLPYSRIVGQDELKLALELAFISPRIGGVLISGQRGTAKSTAARSFALLAYGKLPVTLPINATDDRVLGGWRIDELMRGNPQEQPGLLEAAAESGLLYIDEVNLLDDHLVNIILDVVSTGLLSVQREAIDKPDKELSFLLVGTMNPEEGGLRPQLLDRFGLMVNVKAENDIDRRRKILEAVLNLDRARATGDYTWILSAQTEDEQRRQQLADAQERLYDVQIPLAIANQCVALCVAFDATGHRGDYVMALAARALAALEGATAVTSDHVARVVRLALQHRRPSGTRGGQGDWTPEDDAKLRHVLDND